MKLFVAVPSLSRPEAITKKTYSWLKDVKEFDWKIFVEPQERFLYEYYCGKENVVVLDKSSQGLGYALNFERRYAKENGYDLIFQVDDDVTAFVRTDEDDPAKAFEMTAKDIASEFEKDPQLGGVRFTQYRFWLYSKKNMKRFTHKNKPLQGVAIMRLKAMEILPEYAVEFTDTIDSLFIWRNGYYTLSYGLAGLNVIQNANKGGMQTLDRKQNAIGTIEAMKEHFPLVYEKEGSSWFGVDVDISAYDESETL